jgi:hypothetical protein
MWQSLITTASVAGGFPLSDFRAQATRPLPALCEDSGRGGGKRIAGLKRPPDIDVIHSGPEESSFDRA